MLFAYPKKQEMMRVAGIIDGILGTETTGEMYYNGYRVDEDVSGLCGVFEAIYETIWDAGVENFGHEPEGGKDEESYDEEYEKYFDAYQDFRDKPYIDINFTVIMVGMYLHGLSEQLAHAADDGIDDVDFIDLRQFFGQICISLLYSLSTHIWMSHEDVYSLTKEELERYWDIGRTWLSWPWPLPTPPEQNKTEKDEGDE